jgi:hypothetical protein
MVLLPGDVVTIPDKKPLEKTPCAAGQEHKVVIHRHPMYLVLELVDIDGEPFPSGTNYTYTSVVGAASGLKATISHDERHVTVGAGLHDHTFAINGTAADSATSGLAAFSGTGTVDVAIAGNDLLCTWWNPYGHKDTDTHGTVTATLVYNYTLRVKVEIKPETLKLGSKGVFTAAIELPESYGAGGGSRLRYLCAGGELLRHAGRQGRVQLGLCG